MREDIIAFFKDIAPEAYHVEDAAYMLGVKGAEALNAYMQCIRQLCEEGILMTKDNFYYRFNGKGAVEVEGVYKGYRKTFGFVITEEGQEDIYVPAEYKNGAMHNDTVRVRITEQGYGSRKKEGVIVGIVKRANPTLVGTYDRQKKFGFVVPDDERIGEDIYVAHDKSLEARSGAKVLVQITQWPGEGRRPEGEIIQVLGYEGDIGLDINCIMANHKLPFAFPDKVLQAAEKAARQPVILGKRWDLRAWQLITIDGEDAKDLDDAVSIKRLPNGNFSLGVHIADVSHYVTSRSDLDKEAYKRGTSVYLVDRVIPMLPPVLSNGICSLNAGEDRYAMSCVMEVDKSGQVLHYTICPSVIRVGRRCSYREVYKALAEDVVPDDLQPYLPMLRELNEVAQILTKMRQRRGALDFDFPEFKIILDTDGTPLRIQRKDRTLAECLIEECMLIANETVATHLEKTERTSVYRIHERPNEEKLGNLQRVINYLGQTTIFAAETIEPRDLQKFLAAVAGTEIERVAQVMTLRAMQQAKYSASNVGHFGLASACYTHFTSPIRRYPDLMVHRLLKLDMQWESGWHSRDGQADYLTQAAVHCSEREQVAVEAERETDDLKKTQYMEPFVGQSFTGYVNSITSFGLFVELENGIDGLVPLGLMDDDYYFFDEEHFLLVGRHSGNTYHLGQEVTVTLVNVNVEKRQIDFVIGEVEDLHALQERLAERETEWRTGKKGMQRKAKHKEQTSKGGHRGKSGKKSTRAKGKQGKKQKKQGKKKRR